MYQRGNNSRKHLLAAVSALCLSACTHSPKIIADCDCGMITQPKFVLPDEADLVSRVGDRVFFTFGSAQVKATPLAPGDGSKNTDTLRNQLLWLIKHPNVKILIAGNTDERGSESYNLTLGKRRADAVREYLVADGIDPDRIKTISYGKERPIEAGHNEAAWQANRVAVTSVQGYNPQYRASH
jgi:peptidoglycan-associated lipoprotein